MLFAEPLEVQVLDEFRQGHLPGFLVVVIDLPELGWIHAQLAGHLHLGVREVMPLPRIDPRLEPHRDLLGRHALSDLHALSVFRPPSPPGPETVPDRRLGMLGDEWYRRSAWK